MKARGVTQGQIATALDCSQTAVSNLLAGKSRLAVDDVVKIATTLGISFNELIAEATQDSRGPVNLSQEAEAYICGNNLAFYLINRLKEPSNLKELQSEFDEEKKNEIEKIIIEFKKFNLVTEDTTGRLTLSFHGSNVLHFRLTEEYSNRITEIYSMLRPVVKTIATSQKKIKAWKHKNVDAFYFEFFTEDQILQQNALLRQFLDLAKHQIRMNQNSDPNLFQKEKMELRVVYTVSAPFPNKKMMEEYE